ncbi:hypothetical protein BXY85_3612 [Roseivirga pacifica]|uniref:RiboL-PSP-HEPN domain-containing protein n=1 Tax=Roseivirga pacifica TaxID=1267423 RepID=A0A1I0QEW1_9BACT|nr:hypothetical protein [Roseivirga pacifica]RKQ42993.1 hypothetical protein BXY85_3612 [Roseivirga pacifica]SEW25494.1 hypothetical protein SAMN05216290_2263 [Roseivirga pacifica]
MKTKELKNFHKVLSELNNSFTHYSFVWNQFNIDYSETLEKNPEILTKDYFDENPFKRKHNIKLCELRKEHSKTNESLIQGIFLLIYTHFESYLKDLLIFSQKVNDKIEPLESKLEGVENDFMLIDKVFNRIEPNNLQSELMITLDYIRLKRNRLIHSNAENISNSLNRLIKKEGISLNKYWNSKLPSELQGIDFNDKKNANELTFSVIIDVINIFRGISNEIDNVVTDKLTKNSITEAEIIPKFKDAIRKKINGIKTERVVSKFVKYCQSEYSMTVDDEQIKLLKCSIV